MSPDATMRVVADLTVELVRIRQAGCPHVCVENVGPEIFSKLLRIASACERYEKALQTMEEAIAKGSARIFTA